MESTVISIPHLLLQVLNNVNFYYNAQKVGQLPPSVTQQTPWIQSSLLQEETAGPLGRNVAGGWLTGAAAYSTKDVIPTAFAISMMAWSLIRYTLVTY